MQLMKYSLITAALLFQAQAEEYISVQYLQYNENDSRTNVSAPSIMLKKDLNANYSLSANLVVDTVGGATPTYYDAASGASAFSRGTTTTANINYGNVEYHDTRTAGGATLTQRLQNRDELTYGLNSSRESDFYSTELSADYMHWMHADKNQALSFGISYQSNQILVRHCDTNAACTTSGASQAMSAEVVTAQLGFKQNISAKSYIKAALFSIQETGYLSNPYLNVVINYQTTPEIASDMRPDSRTAFGGALKYAYALSDALTSMSDYRYYSDDWDISSHTFEQKFYYQLNPTWLFKTGGRFYTQTKSNFYSGSADFFTNETYRSSDFRMSAFDATTLNIGFEYTQDEHYTYDLELNSYDQSTNLSAIYIIAGLTYRF